jgi:ribosome-associated translation inhibitor RaiA
MRLALKTSYQLKNNMKEKKNLISLAKESIYHLYPIVISMDVDMIRLTNNRYKSKVVLKTKKKSFFANKEAPNYKESLDRSCHAIKKQLEKFKIDRVHQSSKESVFEDEVDKLYYNDTGGEG